MDIRLNTLSVLMAHELDFSWVKIITAPKKDKSPGPDGIPPPLLKELAEEISYPLSSIFQTSLDSGRLPKDWLTANVSPIYKGGQRVDPKEFRPVSLTSTCLKVM